MALHGRCLVSGQASGEVLFSNVPLSFWGGTDPIAGKIVDAHHPLCGELLAGRIVAIPCSRGSCSGSGAILQMLLSDSGPAALIFSFEEEILTAGVIIAKVLFDKQIPVVLLSGEQFAQLECARRVTVLNDRIMFGESNDMVGFQSSNQQYHDQHNLVLADRDRDLLSGVQGKARAAAMQILLDFAKVQGAKELIDVTQSHLDSVHYTGPATTMFAEYLLRFGDATFSMPTSMNSISIDQRRWKALGVGEDFAANSNHLADMYQAMGAKATFTCAPYLLDTAPLAGQHVGWAESNAVVFANSVLGAYTQKYPDMIEVCIALTGRTPLAGCHLEEGRQPTVVVRAPSGKDSDDSFWPLLGYTIGHVSGNRIPLVLELEDEQPTTSNLKAFSAAFATTSSAPMFHIRGTTRGNYIARPSLAKLDLTHEDLFKTWKVLNTAESPNVSVVALGNPHFSVEEFRELAKLTTQYAAKKTDQVQLLITTSRHVLEAITSEGIADMLYSFGADIITDTCWCMIEEPVVQFADSRGTIMTNSAKYAHYAPGIVNRKVHFGSLQECLLASMTGKRMMRPPSWLGASASDGVDGNQ